MNFRGSGGRHWVHARIAGLRSWKQLECRRNLYISVSSTPCINPKPGGLVCCCLNGCEDMCATRLETRTVCSPLNICAAVPFRLVIMYAGGSLGRSTCNAIREASACCCCDSYIGTCATRLENILRCAPSSCI